VQLMAILEDKVAIVTGSARGIGRATAELLSEQGAKVVINDLDGDVAEQTASEIKGDTLVFGGDLTKPGVPDELVNKVIDASGKSAVIGLTKTLAKEWGQFKINVNAVAFGFIETRLTAVKEESNTMEIDGQTVQLGIPGQMRELASNLIPLGRAGQPSEAAGG